MSAEEAPQSAWPKLLGSEGAAAVEAIRSERPDMPEVLKVSEGIMEEFSRARDRYDRREQHLKQLYDELRKEYGQAFDHLEPYINATQELTTVSHRVHTAVGEFKTASAEHRKAQADLKEFEDRQAASHGDDALTKQGLDAALMVSKATEKVHRAREERDLKETAYTNVRTEYGAAQAGAEARTK